jgi:CheY-like chemotaxis protein
MQERAFEHIKQGHVDIVLLDINMPGKDGLMLAAELRDAHPDTGVAVIFRKPESGDRGPSCLIQRIAGHVIRFWEFSPAQQKTAPRTNPAVCEVNDLG